MNNKGNIMLSLLFFIMALGILVVFISPINDFLDIAQQSDNLNCKGFIYDGSSTNTLSFNDTKHNNVSGSPLACLAIKLYLPYILPTFLIAGIMFLMANKANEVFGFPEARFD